MADATTHETLRALLAEAERAEAVMLRECGMGVLNRVVLEQARAVLAANPAARVHAAPLTEAQIEAALNADNIGHQRGEDIRRRPYWLTRGSTSIVRLARAIERAHGITGGPEHG